VSEGPTDERLDKLVSLGGTQLHRLAASTGSSREIKAALMRTPSDVASRTATGMTPLMTAAAMNSGDACHLVIRSLVEAGADIESRDVGSPDQQSTSLEITPLHLAARFNRNPRATRELLRLGAAPEKRVRHRQESSDETTNGAIAEDGATPLQLALAFNEEAVSIELLQPKTTFLAEGEEPTSSALRVLTPLCEIASTREAITADVWPPLLAFEQPSSIELLESMFKAVKRTGALLKMPRTPLGLAALFGHPHSVRTLADVHDVNGDEQRTIKPLHLAPAEARNAGVLNELLNLGARLDTITFDGLTPLTYAIHMRAPLAHIQLLIDHLTDLDDELRGSILNGRPPMIKRSLIVAAMHATDRRVIDMLISAGVDVGLGNPLYWSVFFNDELSITQALLEHGAAPKDIAGRPFGEAISALLEDTMFNGNPDLVRNRLNLVESHSC